VADAPVGARHHGHRLLGPPRTRRHRHRVGSRRQSQEWPRGAGEEMDRGRTIGWLIGYRVGESSLVLEPV
jgi:hypothetical protein